MLTPEIDDALAHFSVTSPAPAAAPTPCAGLDSPNQYVTQSGTAVGSSTDDAPGGRFSLTTGATGLTIKTTNTAKINLLGLSHGVASGSFVLIPTSPANRRLVGTFKAVFRLNAGTGAVPLGRGFLFGTYQRKVAGKWKPTGDVLFANTEFSAVVNGNGTTTTTGTIGSASDTFASGGATADLAEKAIGSCP